jgi:predicted phage tail protein
MMRNVYLQGELGEQFGSVFRMNAANYTEIFKCINANKPDFLAYVRECHENNIDFAVETAGEQEGDDNLLTPLKEGDVTIAIIPAGSKSAFGKILAAIAIIAMIYFGTYFGTEAASLAGVGSSIGGLTAVSVALNLAMAGISQMMAPDPSVDGEGPENYAFNGNAQNIQEGDPIPILYGRLRVPGRPISINIKNSSGYTRNTGAIFGGDGSVTATSSNTYSANKKTGSKQAHER